MSLYDDPFEGMVKYDGACPICHGNPRVCRRENERCPEAAMMEWFTQQAEWREICRERGRHEWYLEHGVIHCRQCGAVVSSMDETDEEDRRLNNETN